MKTLKIIKSVMILFFIALFILMTLLISTFYTNTGLKLAVMIGEKIKPNIFHAESIDGSLYRGLSFKDLQIKRQNLTLSIHNLFIQFDWLASLHKKIAIKNVIANDINANYTDALVGRSSTSKLGFHYLNYFSLQQLKLTNLTIAYNHRPLKITRVLFSKNNHNQILINSPSGNVAGTIYLLVHPFLQWQVNLTGKNINTKEFMPKWDGKINFIFYSIGKWSTPLPSFSIRLQQITGKLDHLPIAGHIDLQSQQGNFILKQSQINIFDATIKATGKLLDNWDLHWHASMPTLHFIAKQLHGSLVTQGDITGPRHHPQIIANFAMHNIQLSSFKIKSLSGKLDSKINSKPIVINLAVKEMAYSHYILPYIKMKNTFVINENNLIGQAIVIVGKDNHIEMDYRLANIKQIMIVPPLAKAMISFDFKNPNQLLQSVPIKIYGQISGSANVNGSWPNPKVNLQLLGNALELKNANEYHIVFSPQLNMQFSDQQLEVAGTINVSQATINPPDFTQVTTLPQDVVIMGTTKSKSITTLPVPKVKLNIALNVKKMKLIYNHFNALLNGSLQIYQTPNRLPIGTGSFNITEGEYKIYGRSLRIDYGKILYAGNLLTDPAVDIRATQRFNKTVFSEDLNAFNRAETQSTYTGTNQLIAGVRVQGHISRPKITFFSDPAGISQEDILSYLVFGVPRSNISSTASLAFLNELASSVSQKTTTANFSTITTTIANKLHLSEFVLGHTEVYDPEKNTTLQTTTINIGRQLGNNLSIHYKAGVFVPLSILSLQYKINKYFILQTEASTFESAADILYAVDIQ